MIDGQVGDSSTTMVPSLPVICLMGKNGGVGVITGVGILRPDTRDDDDGGSNGGGGVLGRGRAVSAGGDIINYIVWGRGGPLETRNKEIK